MDNEINGLSVRLFDSWGLEVGKEQEWLGLLNEELKNRDTGKSSEQWFHSVFYCIAGSGHRVEDFDIQIIKRFINEKYKVAVILTKADLITEDDEEKLRDTVQNHLGQVVPVIPVCSEEKKLRGGIATKRFGKEEVESQAYKDFCDSIILRLPEHCVKVLKQRIDEWLKKQKSYESLPDLWEMFSKPGMKKGLSLTDTSIIREAHNFKKKYTSFGYKVHIWTKDKELKAREPDVEKNPFA